MSFIGTQGGGGGGGGITMGGAITGGTDTQILFNDGGVVGGDAGLTFNKTTAVLALASAGALAWSTDLFLRRRAAGVLAQHNLANPQSYEIYNTTNAGVTVYERGFMRWASNVLEIGTEHAGATGRRIDIIAAGDQISLRPAGLAYPGSLVAENGSLIFYGSSKTNNGGTFSAREIRLSTTPESGTTTAVLFGTAVAGLFALNGVTSSFPALKQSSALMQVRLADDSAFTYIQGQIRTHANAVAEVVVPTHTLLVYDAAGTGYKVTAIAA